MSDSQPTAVAPDGSRSSTRRTDRLDLLEWLVLAVSVAPVVAAVIRRSGTRWIPIGDNALIEMRARDVFSIHHVPLLGTWSSASLTAGKDLNHPGPLLFDILAIPVRLFGGATGVALGVGLVNAAAIVGTALVARRVAGRTGFVAGAAVAALLAHTLGSAMLTDPWNPHVLVLPALLLLVSTWAVAAGDLGAGPVLMAAASLCLQVHLGYVYLAPALVIAGVAGAVVVYRHRWRTDPAARTADLPHVRRATLTSVTTVLVLWAQPLIEQFFGSGQGNLARIATSTGGDEPTIGARLAVRIAGSVMPAPWWWGRRSWVDAVPYTQYRDDGVTLQPVGVRGVAVALLGLSVMVVVPAALAAAARRRRDRPALVAVVVAAIAVVMALASLTIMPIGPLGLTPHQMRWLWSIGAFWMFAVVVAAAPVVAARRPGGAAQASGGRAAWIGAAVVAVVSLANVPAYVQAAGPDTFPEAIPAARALSDQVRRYHTDQAVVLDASNLRYLEPYSAVVLTAMQQAGVDFRVREEGLVRQVGDARRATGDEPLTVFLLEARAALDVPDGSERIAFTSPLTADEIARLLDGEQQMIDEVASFGIVLSESGRQQVEAGAFGMTERQIADAAAEDPVGFVQGGLAAELVAAGALDLDPSVADVFTTTSELRRRVGTDTVAVLIRPA
ncbi:MAG: hypothetical protein U0Q03_12360 [Acidimicrobiales bacterium]